MIMLFNKHFVTLSHRLCFSPISQFYLCLSKTILQRNISPESQTYISGFEDIEESTEKERHQTKIKEYKITPSLKML